MAKFIKSGISVGLALVLMTGVVFAGENGHEDHSRASMTMHHMHIMINNAVAMAAEGSNMVMTGQMDMAKGIDNISIKQGRKMIEDAEKLATEVLNGKAMKALHTGGYGQNVSPEMAYTHELASVALAYIQAMKKMSASPASHE
ncbi:hypothetical protein [Geopsychrobacter electrodiphilus]|uniref:hypothetical protein n=1 Tax=Geopsychrobacter electrodiphilus TaxID=225196 RepID=UPI0003684B2F|nr:hypothetical protein [Geopsychrobacter electrodiphilus]